MTYPVSGHAPGAKKLVGIVEDDESMLRATETLLAAHGFGTRGFSSAEEFLAADAPVDCLLLDIDLGGLSGIDLWRRLIAAGSTVPVIFMTALDSETMQQRAAKAGCVAYLRKPFPASQLLDAIQKALA
jgi:FixJ family two-component response regulator